MNTLRRRLYRRGMILLLACGLPLATLVTGVVAPVTAVSARKAHITCRTFDAVHFLLATGIETIYGGVICDMQ